MATSIKISQLPAKGANLEATDLLEVSEFNGTGYVTKSITGQEIIDSASGGGGVTDVTATAPITSTGGTTPDISMAVADAGHDGYLSSTDWNIFNDKQDLLVSATNIKTINGSSVLGSGDLVVSGGGGSGIHAPLVVSGRAVSFMTTSALSLPTSALSTLRIYAMPFIPMVSFTSASFYINVATFQASAIGRILIYSDLNNLPNTKLYESVNLDLSTNGIKTVTASFTFNAGTTYWICFHSQGTATISHLSATSVLPISFGGVAAPTTYFYPTVAYAIGSAPITLSTFNSGNGNVPFIGITSA